MKLSKQEKTWARLPRLFESYVLTEEHHSNHITHFTPTPVRKAIRNIIYMYAVDCTLKLNNVLPKVATKYSTTPEEVINYLKNHLLFADNQINNPHIIKLQHALSFADYANNPEMLFQRLAFLSCSHNYSFAMSAIINFQFNENEPVFDVFIETIRLLSAYPELSTNKQSLAKVLAFRLGIPYTITFNILDKDLINPIFAEHKYKSYLERFNDTHLLTVCTEIAQEHRSNWDIVI